MRSIKLGSIRNPSGKLDFMDATGWNPEYSHAVSSSYYTKNGEGTIMGVAYRHSRKVNASFYDGHVQGGLAENELITSGKSGVVRAIPAPTIFITSTGISRIGKQ